MGTNVQNVPSEVRTVLVSMKKTFSFGKLLENSSWSVHTLPTTREQKPVTFACSFYGFWTPIATLCPN